MHIRIYICTHTRSQINPHTHKHTRSKRNGERERGENYVRTTNDTMSQRHRRKQTHALLPDTQGHVETNEPK